VKELCNSASGAGIPLLWPREGNRLSKTVSAIIHTFYVAYEARQNGNHGLFGRG
jgi:hypothetical protein